MSDDAKTKVKNESNDRLYFTVTPRLVWALCEDPDEYTLWCVVKDIAGEDGECILSRDDLAALAMMSGGRVSQCRDSLIGKKLLHGDFRRDPGYPQAVWHLSVPDFWEANTRWARQHPKLADRVNFKKQQAASRRMFKKEPSQDDASKEPSQDDRGVSPDDGGMSPDDAKKNVFKNQKEEQIMPGQKEWTATLEILKADMHKGTFETYLKNTLVVRYDGNTLEIGTPTTASRDWLENRITRTAERALVGITTQDISVRFIAIDGVPA